MDKTTALPLSRLQWIARALLVASALGIALCSYLFFSPNNYPFSFAGPQVGQLLWYGGAALIIALFAWISPGPGGIVAVLYGTSELYLNVLLGHLYSPQTLIPTGALIGLYAALIISGILSIIVGITRIPKKAGDPAAGVKRLLWAARILAFLPMILAAIMLIIEPLPFIAGVIPGLIITGIAWFWPGAGGLLMLVLTLPGSYALFQSNWGFDQKLPYYIFCLIFAVSGVLHLIYTWQRRDKRED